MRVENSDVINRSRTETHVRTRVNRSWVWPTTHKVKRLGATSSVPKVQVHQALSTLVSNLPHLKLSNDQELKLRGLALHHMTGHMTSGHGLSSAVQLHHNKRAHFEAVAQKYCSDSSDQETRILLEANPEFPDLEPLAVKRKRIKLEERIQRDLIKGHMGISSDKSLRADYKHNPQMYLDSTSLI